MPEESEAYKNRDLLLGEIHQSTKNTELVLKDVKDWCKDHDKKDDKRFLIGGIAILILGVSAGILPELIKLLTGG